MISEAVLSLLNFGAGLAVLAYIVGNFSQLSGSARVRQGPRRKLVDNGNREWIFGLPVFAFGSLIDHIGLGSGYRLARWIIGFGGAALLLYIGIVLPLSYTAGKETFINVVTKAVLDLDLYILLPWVGAVVLFGLWQVERFLRKTSVRREHTRVEKLEKDRDPNWREHEQ